MAPGNQFKFNC